MFSRLQPTKGLGFTRGEGDVVSAEGPGPNGDRSRTFVLRLWFEIRGEGDDGGEWRGDIRDVITNSRVSFRHLEGLAAAVRELGLDGR